MTLPAAYCPECNCYFVLQSDFEMIVNMGTPICKVIEDIVFYKTHTTFDNLHTESILKAYKYNVQKDIYSDQERQDILANIIDNQITTPIQIVSYLKAFAARKINLPSYQLAVSKWYADIEFVKTYQKDKTRRVYIKSIRYLKYIKNIET